MAVLRFPCWICGQLTDGADSYVVCTNCIDEIDVESGRPSSSGGLAAPPGSCVQTAQAQDEIDARLRKLLDDW